MGNTSDSQRLGINEHDDGGKGKGLVTRLVLHVARNASEDEPAYLIEQEDGDRVLKSHSGVTKSS